MKQLLAGNILPAARAALTAIASGNPTAGAAGVKSYGAGAYGTRQRVKRLLFQKRIVLGKAEQVSLSVKKRLAGHMPPPTKVIVKAIRGTYPVNGIASAIARDLPQEVQV